jgi:adenylate cyclase
VRLACQLRPTHNLAVIPLLPVHTQASAGFAAPGHHAGQEQEIAVLFADLRGFTRLAEPKLPYDVVFFLNRYFETIGSAIKNAGGIANQFTGDGVMALFGVGQGPTEGCRRALLAASAMLDSLAELTQTLADELPDPLRMALGSTPGRPSSGVWAMPRRPISQRWGTPSTLPVGWRGSPRNTTAKWCSLSKSPGA